jgi:hypothetical protein
MMRIYVASSWRNKYQPGVVVALQGLGHEVYDFRNPPNRSGFGWGQIANNWREWSPEEFRRALAHPLAIAGYASDIEAVRRCDLGVLVLPSGRSASFEAGVMFGMRKPVIVFMPEPCEPELMYRECEIATSMPELLGDVRHQEARQGVWTGVR